MSFALLFPGQGSQSLGMMKGFADNNSVKQTFQEASDELGSDLWAMCQEGADLATINATTNTQPLMLTAGVAIYRAWLAAGGQKPAIAAGHSLGEYTALVASGALRFADAVKLVQLRAKAMQSAVPEGKGAMAAILGLDDATIIAACAEAAQGSVVEAVNFNSQGQVVIAGEKAAVERAMELCKAKGAKRALPLPVSVPSHCALMKPAADTLATALASLTLNTPEFPVLHNADVTSYADTDKIKDALVRQLYQPVRWVETVQSMAASGVHVMAECGPGKVLVGLNKRIAAEAQHIALIDTESLATLKAAL